MYNLDASNLKKRILATFKKGYENNLISCDEKYGAISISGYIGKPENSKRTRGEQFLFVNNRFIKSAYINHAIKNSYEGLIEEKKFPFYLLFIKINTDLVDINIHPTKTEINTCNPFLIRQIKFVQPKILLLLGSPSMKMVLGDDYQITKVRGQWFKAPVDYMEDSLYVMPVFHPAYLLRNASKDEGAPKWLTWQDMKEVKAALSFYEQS